jgi:hypothetical protein
MAVFLTLLILVFEKAVATNAQDARSTAARLSRCLDVGVAPLGIASVVIGATLLADVLTQAV